MTQRNFKIVRIERENKRSKSNSLQKLYKYQKNIMQESRDFNSFIAFAKYDLME